MRRLPDALSQVEVYALLQQFRPGTLNGLRNLATVLLMLRAGLRVSEVSHLRPADLDRQTARLMIRNGKGDKDRAVFLDPELLAVVGLWLEKRPAGEWLVCSLRRGVRGYGTASYAGQFTSRGIQQMLARASKTAGVRRVHPHMLRHTFATTELTRGVPLNQLQADLGHSWLSTTAIYLHLVDGQREQSARERKPLGIVT